MTLRIQEQLDKPDCTTFALSGRIRSEHILHLASLLEQERGRIVLDLKEVTIVGREAIRFLAACETKGYCRGQIVIQRESGESAFSSEIEDNLSRLAYKRPQIVTLDQAVFKMTDEHVAVHDRLAVSQLRSCFLAGTRTELKPMAVRSL